MLQVFGQLVKTTDSLDCDWKADHRKLVSDASVDYLNRGVLPDDKFVLCGKCRMAVSLKI